MFRLTIAALAALSATSLALADEPSRDWPSARFRGTTPVQPPCTCRSLAGSVEVGTATCVPTPEGGRRALCVMVENNPSWRFSDQVCGTTASLTH